LASSISTTPIISSFSSINLTGVTRIRSLMRGPVGALSPARKNRLRAMVQFPKIGYAIELHDHHRAEGGGGT